MRARGNHGVDATRLARALVPGREALREALGRAHGGIRDEGGRVVARRGEPLGERREARRRYGALSGRTRERSACDTGQSPVSSDASASCVAGAAAIASSKTTPSRASAASAGAVGRP
jgi:hypothetical protein